MKAKAMHKSKATPLSLSTMICGRRSTLFLLTAAASIFLLRAFTRWGGAGDASSPRVSDAPFSSKKGASSAGGRAASGGGARAPDAAAGATERGGGAAGGSATTWQPDPLFAPFAEGRGVNTWGLNIVAWAAALDPPADDEPTSFRAVYEKWRATAELELEGTGAFVYPWEALHVTAMTPAPFPAEEKRADWTENDREILTATWANIMHASQHDSARWPEKPVELIFTTPRLIRGVGILQVIDQTGAVGKVREALSRAAKPSEMWGYAGRSNTLRESSGEKTPSIVHSTVMRLASPRAPGMTDAEITARFGRAAAAWPGPIPVAAKGLWLVEGNELASLTAENPLDSVRYASTFAKHRDAPDGK